MKFLLMSLLFLSSGLSAAFFEGENDTLFIVGSTSVSQLIKQTKRPFYDKTGINILVRPIGSQKGVTSIGESVSDIAIISRFLTPQEQAKYPKLSQITIGQDAIVFIVNPKSSITNLTTAEVVDLYTGNNTQNLD